MYLFIFKRDEHLKKTITLKKMTPFLLSAFWVILALWLEFIPKTPGTISGLTYDFFKRIDFLIYDIRQSSTLNPSYLKNSRIVIIAIDNKSIQQEGRWPWRYNKISLLITKLRDQGASVIAFDRVFSEPEKNVVSIIKNNLLKKNVDNKMLFDTLNELEPEFDDNAHLIQQVKNKNDIVLSFYLDNIKYSQGLLPKPVALLNKDDLNRISIMAMPGYITNFSELQSASSYSGFKSTLTDEDGVIRRTPLVLRYQNKVYLSLPMIIAQLLFPERQVKLHMVDIANKKYLESIQFGNQKIPTDKAGRVLIPFHGISHSFKYYSATDVLQDKLKPDTLKHAIVLIGTTAEGLSGLKNTSVDDMMPNVEIVANVLTGILDNSFPELPFWAKSATVGLILIIGILLTVLLPLVSAGLAILLATLTLSLLISANIGLWVTMGLVFSFSVPLIMAVILIITNMAYGFLFESRKKKLLRETFSQYVAPDYVKILIDNPEQYSLNGESAELTVLFADIRHFTHISEKLEATQVKKLLNHYFTPMTQIIFNYGGTIDKYVGDMIMAFWGAPIKNTAHREAAINTALDMLAKTEELKDSFVKDALPEVNIGIGINTGIMNVGDMGSVFRRSYTVLGDAVNLGARLESLTKYYGIKLLVTSHTIEGQTKFLFRWIDKVKVKGKSNAVDIYEVLCRLEDASPELLEEIAAHEKASFAYKKADWTLAQTLFSCLVKQYPNTTLYELFLQRVKDFSKNQPPSDWDGSYELKEK